MSTVVRKWWKEGTAYQIWPASYKDSNGDGIGDLGGIIESLDQLKELGVDILWVSPAYASPQKDMGYDISDYEDIDPQYGTLQDAERLIAECHARQIRILFDLVINHTSDQHAWFKESRSSRDNAKRDWFIWRPAKHDADGTRRPPNNWASLFGGSAWEWDEGSQEYYLHLFATEQPDLNWENPVTRKAVYASAVTFWLDKGIDGFRIDTSNLYSKPTEFPDAAVVDPGAAFQPAHDHFINGPKMHDYLRELYRETLKGRDVTTVGELPHTADVAHVLRYVSAQAEQMDMVFQFNVAELGRAPPDNMILKPYTFADFTHAYASMQELSADDSQDGWGTAFLENHDLPRSVSRYGCDDDQWRARSAKLLALLLCASSGTLFLYQGQEIGVRNAPAAWGREGYRDVDAVNYINAQRARYPDEADAAEQRAIQRLNQLGRDNARAPIPWTREGPYAGFLSTPEPTTTTTSQSHRKEAAKPWFPLHPGFEEGWNVADQRADPASVRSFWRTALQLRKRQPGVFAYGRFQLWEGKGEGERVMVFAKEDGAGIDRVDATGGLESDGGGPREGGVSADGTRRNDGKNVRVVVVLNFSSERGKMPSFDGKADGIVLGRVLLSNLDDGAEKRDERRNDEWLEPWEGRIYDVL